MIRDSVAFADLCHRYLIVLRVATTRFADLVLGSQRDCRRPGRAGYGGGLSLGRGGRGKPDLAPGWCRGTRRLGKKVWVDGEDARGAARSVFGTGAELDDGEDVGLAKLGDDEGGRRIMWVGEEGVVSSALPLSFSEL